MQRIGVFVCHCGTNIAATVDVKKVVEMAKMEPGVVHAEDAKKVVLQGLDGYIVSEKNGQILVCRRSEEQRIREFSLD